MKSNKKIKMGFESDFLGRFLTEVGSLVQNLLAA